MREDQQLEIFIRKHYSSMCAVALRFIGSPDIAQDITQEVIIKFWKNRANYENIKSTDNFLYTMIKNESLTYPQKKRKVSSFLRTPLSISYHLIVEYKILYILSKINP